jgi:outer membrane cobalamin receptor
MKLYFISFVLVVIVINNELLAQDSHLENTDNKLEITITKPIIKEKQAQILSIQEKGQQEKNIKDILFGASDVSFAGSSVSGISIQGAPKRFSNIYYNGINLTDPSAIGLYNPVFSHFNLGDYSNIHINTESVSILKGAGVAGSIEIKNKIKQSFLSTSFGDNDYTQKSAGIYHNQDGTEAAISITTKSQTNLTSYSDVTDEFDKSSEKDQLTSFDTTFNFNKIWNKYNKTTIDYLKVTSEEEYDDGFPPDKDDNNSIFKRNFSASGMVHNFFYDNIYRKTTLKLTQTESHNENTNTLQPDSKSNVRMQELNHKEPIGDKFSFFLGAREEREQVVITDTIDKKKSTESKIAGFAWDYNSLKLSTTIKKNEFKNIEKTTTSTDRSSYLHKKFNFSEGLWIPFYSQSKTYKAPEILYIYNPYGLANFELKGESVTQTNYGFKYKNPIFSLVWTRFDKDIKDYINWVTINPVTFVGQYQNIDEVKIKGDSLKFTSSLPFLSKNHTFNFAITDIDKAQDKRGLRLTETPNNVTTASYSFKKTNDKELTFSYREQKGQLAASSTATNKVKVSDYELFDVAYTHYFKPTFKMKFIVENIKDTYYQKTQNYQGKPRTIKTSFTLLF